MALEPGLTIRQAEHVQVGSKALNVIAVLVLLVVGACADGTAPSEVASSTTTQAGPTSADGSNEPLASDGAASTTITSDLTVEKVIAWINASHPGSPLACNETGQLDVGDVFACGGPSAAPASTLVEYGGTVIYVIDESGRAAWASGTDVPGPTDDLLASYQRVPKGLFCRDLLSSGTDAFPFSGQGDGRPAFFWSLVYWSLEGEPERMDADLDGIPCETLYDTDVIDDVLAGGPAAQ